MTEVKSMDDDKSGITTYFHCRRCIQQLPKGQSPASYARTQIGLVAPNKVRVWCNRHNILVCDIVGDLELIATQRVS